MSFDAENVFLRYLRVGEHEVLRGINAPIRDQNWATVVPEIPITLSPYGIVRIDWAVD